MARRNFYEIITQSSFNLRAEYTRLYTLFYEDTDFYYSISDMIENAFECFSPALVGRTISLDDFNTTYGFDFSKNPAHLATDILISFAEYISNFCRALLEDAMHTLDEDLYNSVLHIQKMVTACMSDLGLKEQKVEGVLIYIEDRPDTIAVVELLEDGLAGSVMSYHHHSLKGDLARKKSVLKLMADNIESDRPRLKGINSTLETQLFQLLNKFIRHDQSRTPYIGTMNPQEIEECYDDIYQMWLLAKLELDHQTSRKDRIKDLLDRINA